MPRRCQAEQRMGMQRNSNGRQNTDTAKYAQDCYGVAWRGKEAQRLSEECVGMAEPGGAEQWLRLDLRSQAKQRNGTDLHCNGTALKCSGDATIAQTSEGLA